MVGISVLIGVDRRMRIRALWKEVLTGHGYSISGIELQMSAISASSKTYSANNSSSVQIWLHS